MLWYRIRFWVVRWLIGGPSSSGGSTDGGPPQASSPGTAGSDGSGDGGAPPAARRRRQRRAPRRRRGCREAVPQEGAATTGPRGADVVASVPSGALVANGGTAVISPQRWAPEHSPRARAGVIEGGPAGDAGLAAFREPSAHGAKLLLQAPCPGNACSAPGSPAHTPPVCCSMASRGPVNNAMGGSPSLRSSASSCSTMWVGSACLRGDSAALRAAESFLSWNRAAPEEDAVSPQHLSRPWSPSVTPQGQLATCRSLSKVQETALSPEPVSELRGSGGAESRGLTSGPSDRHAAASVACAHAEVGKRFLFERFCLKLPGFDDEVKALWEGEDIDDATPVDPLKRLAYRLRRTSRGLQRWSQRRVGSIRDSILIANEVILRFDVAQEARSLSEQEQWLRRNLKLKLLGLASLERTIARQRARVAALKDGDASSQFFRIMASLRRRQSSISSLRWGDCTAADLPGKIELATEFYMGLMGSAQPRDTDISLAALGLGQVDLSDLEAQFTEAEVWDALRAMPTNKSPGPDGFTWEFYRHCWHVIKGDVLASLQSIWLGRDQGFDALNEALITLLPKTDGAVDLKDFRLISLVHSFARLLTKVLARRLGPKMDLLVAPNQTAFIRGRCIQDNFLLVRESVKLLHRKRSPALLLKVVKLVQPRTRRSRTVQQGRFGNSWALDISGTLSVDAVVQYLRLWSAVSTVPVATPGLAERDSFRWKWSADGSFSSRGAYDALFQGTIGLPAARLVWDSFAPLKHKLHAWLALRRRCWTADRRLRRGLPSHSICPLCATADETLDHLSLHCVYAQELWSTATGHCAHGGHRNQRLVAASDRKVLQGS
ncbi:hypothetical protein ACQ4PT_045717 [Festuca glaucescens]